jgi:cytochrome bd ubiquinol oxidase subunit II
VAGAAWTRSARTTAWPRNAGPALTGTEPSLGQFTGTFTDLLNPYSLFTGVTVVLLCLLEGASFLALKTAGALRQRALRVGRPVALVAAAAVLGFVVWTQAMAGKGSLPPLPAVVAVLAALVAAWQVGRGRDGLAFAATSVTMAAVVVTLFVTLYPRVMVSTLGSANDLTTTNTSSAPYTLKVMTVAAAILFPVVLIYQGWTYYVFRRRVGGADAIVGPAMGGADATAEPAEGAG